MPLAVRKKTPAIRGGFRFRPIVPIHIVAPRILPPLDACLYSACDDTVFPLQWATRLGVDLSSAPLGQSQAVGGSLYQVYFADVTLLLSDGIETFRWDTVVGFSTAN